MKFQYIPIRLLQAKKDIIRSHDKEQEIIFQKPSEELKNLIMRLVNLELFQVRSTAMTLTDTEVVQAAGYLPYNYYNVPLDNLFQIFSYRSNRFLCRILFRQWQNAYNNNQCNAFMVEQLRKNEDFILEVRSHNLEENKFSQILESRNIALEFGRKYIRNLTLQKDISLSDKMTYFGIEEESRLYQDMGKLFYTFCSRDDYMSVKKQDLLNAVRQYKEEIKKLFLENFLSSLSLAELNEFTELARYLLTVTGVQEENKFHDFFSGMQEDTITKYKNWLHILTVETLFGDDERSIFWKEYRFQSVASCKKSKAVMMEFDAYYAVEFLGKNKGPMYFYKKNDFETYIKTKLYSYNHSKAKSLLYKTYTAGQPCRSCFRKEHQTGWQDEVRDLLIKNKITEQV